MSTFNGWTILDMPAFPACPRSIEWRFGDVVGESMSPFSLQKQFFAWNQSIIRASLSYQPMSNAQARAWFAWLASLQGTLAIFQFGDPTQLGPQNPSATAGVVSGANQTGYSLVTTSSGLTPGDWIQLGLRLYMVTSVSGGTLGIFPCIRESPSNGQALTINNTQGLFRLMKNDRQIMVNEDHSYSLTFEIEEAL